MAESPDLKAQTNAIVYRLFTDTGALLYVGMTQRGMMRLGEHLNQQPWWPLVANVSITHYADRKTAVQAEKDAIRSESPRHNRRGQTPVPRPIPIKPPVSCPSLFRRPRHHLKTRLFAYAVQQGIRGDATLAKRLGIAQSSVFRLRKGEIGPTARLVERALQAFPDASWETLFYFDVEEPTRA